MAQTHERAPLLGDVEDPQDDGLLHGGAGGAQENKALLPQQPAKKEKETKINYTALQEKLDPKALQALCCNTLCGKDCCSASAANIAFWATYAPLAAGFIFLNIWMVLLWNNHRNDRIKCEHDLPGWLFISGVTGLGGWFLSLLGRGFFFIDCGKAEQGATEMSCWAKTKLYLFGITLAFGLFMLVFDIAWSTLGFWGVLDIPATHVCPAAVYDFTKWYLIAYWAVLGAGLLTTCVLCCVMASNMSHAMKDMMDAVFKEEEVAEKPAAAAAPAPAHQ